MDSHYPAGPASVPADLTAPSSAYKRHAWLAVAGLALFVVAYSGLLGWFGWTAWRLYSAVFGGDFSVLDLLVGTGALFLAIFMAKALVFVKRSRPVDDVELRPADEPRLFAFLHRLADEAGAPRPHKVYLSPRVNAAVFYDLSLLNLIVPSRKNLEIGLGLANVLDVGELKAVLAHEFGHFAQRTMAVGRWVYIAQQVAGHIIAKRDALDTMLSVLSRIDLRVAWIGWLLSLVVWSIRSLVELLFRVVVLAQRALSREMEYQADLVAASLSGSDALVHALHRLHAADDAWSRAVDFAADEFGAGRPVADVFAVQTRIIERMRAVLADPHYGVAPAVPEGQGAGHRLFRTEIARPPQMWATHPANADREENVKRVYLHAPGDPRPALELFADPDALKRRLSAALFTQGTATPEPVPVDESLARVDENYRRVSYDRRYRGAYLGRVPHRVCKSSAELYGASTGGDLAAAISALYPSEYGDRLDRIRDLEAERATLEEVRGGFRVAPGGVVRWRGTEVRVRALHRIIADLDMELAPIRAAVDEHDRHCRSVHAAAAAQVAPGFDAYLRGLSDLVHYAVHAEADVRDAEGLLQNTFEIVTADRKVSDKERRRLVASANDLQRSLAMVYGQADMVRTGEAVAKRLGIASWVGLLGDLRLPPATEQNIGDWLQNAGGWAQVTANKLGALRGAALDTLLEAEDAVATGLAGGPVPAVPAQTPAVPGEYRVLLPGGERRRQTKLGWWDRFQTATGVVPTVARLAAAGGVVAAVIALGGGVGTRPLHVYNGLAVPVHVDVAGVAADVPARTSTTLELPLADTYRVTATVDGETVESFDAEGGGGAHAYNVAGAAALYSQRVGYGSVQGSDPKLLGNPRWFSATQDVVFSPPPEQINTGKSDGGSRTVLDAVEDVAPSRLAANLDPKVAAAMAMAHARWDAPADREMLEWVAIAGDQPGFPELLVARLKSMPDNVLLRRLEQDRATAEAKPGICADHQARADADPESASWRYLALRCARESPESIQAWLDAEVRWPDHPWISHGAAYAHAARGDWPAAEAGLRESVKQLRMLAPGTAVDLARVRRVQTPEAELRGFAGDSEYLATLLALESGDGFEGLPEFGYSHLARGELEVGADVSAVDDELGLSVLWLAAASTGAPDSLRERAFARGLPPARDTAAWSAVALAARAGVPAVELERELAAQAGGSADEVFAFFAAVRAGASVEAAEAELRSAEPVKRGIAYSMAATYLGDRCPAAWRAGARALLFVNERPWFG